MVYIISFFVFKVYGLTLLRFKVNKGLYTKNVYGKYMVNGQLVHTNLSEDMVKKLDKVAEVEHETRSTVIRQAIKEYLDKKLLELGDRVG